MTEHRQECRGEFDGVSVVIPVFNEGENVARLHAELREELNRLGKEHEILFVDDGSRDGTVEVLRQVCRQDASVSVIRLSRNFGQSAAIQAGFDHARGATIVTLDGDCQNDPADIGRLLGGISDGFDVVTGWRRARRDRFITRRLPSLFANWLIAKLTGVSVHDNGCTLKAYRGELVRTATLYSDMHRFMVPLFSMSGVSYTELEVNHRPRVSGVSKYGVGRIWRVFFDLLTLGMLLRATSRPALWFVLLSLPFLLGTALTSLGTLYLYLGGGAENGFPIVLPSVFALLAFASLHLLVLGLAAELIVWMGDYRQQDVLLSRIEGAEGHSGAWSV